MLEWAPRLVDWFRTAPKFSLMGGAAAGLVVLLFAFTVSRLAEVAYTNCRQVELVKLEIRTVLNQSLQTLGQPGTAGYAYYRQHPEELAQTRRSLRTELAQFTARRC